MKRGIENGDLGDLISEQRNTRLDRKEVCWVMEGCEFLKSFYILHNLLVDNDRLIIYIAALNDSVSDCGDLII